MGCLFVLRSAMEAAWKILEVDPEDPRAIQAVGDYGAELVLLHTIPPSAVVYGKSIPGTDPEQRCTRREPRNDERPPRVHAIRFWR